MKNRVGGRRRRVLGVVPGSIDNRMVLLILLYILVECFFNFVNMQSTQSMGCEGVR